MYEKKRKKIIPRNAKNDLSEYTLQRGLENNNKLKNCFSCQVLNENIYKVQVVLMKCHVTAL